MLNFARLRGEVKSVNKDHQVGELIFYSVELDTKDSILVLKVPDILLEQELKVGDFINVKAQLKYSRGANKLYLNASKIEKFNREGYEKNNIDIYVNSLIIDAEYISSNKKGLDSEFIFKHHNKYKKDVQFTVKCPSVNLVKACLSLDKNKYYTLIGKLIQNEENMYLILSKYKKLK